VHVRNEHQRTVLRGFLRLDRGLQLVVDCDVVYVNARHEFLRLELVARHLEEPGHGDLELVVRHLNRLVGYRARCVADDRHELEDVGRMDHQCLLLLPALAYLVLRRHELFLAERARRTSRLYRGLLFLNQGDIGTLVQRLLHLEVLFRRAELDLHAVALDGYEVALDFPELLEEARVKDLVPRRSLLRLRYQDHLQ